MAFWRRLLEGTSWQTLISYVSPTFFQLVSPRDVSRSAYRLARNWFDEKKFIEAVNARSAAVEELNCGLTVTGTVRRKRDRLPFHSEAPAAVDGDSPSSTGEGVLTLFFHQIHTDGPIFLDLRRHHFKCRNDSQQLQCEYFATPLYCFWSPQFRNAMRDLYAAFYGSASKDTYLAALRSIGIEAVADLFDKAFGGERKTAARFQLADFRVTFHDVFMRCVETRSTLHADFLTLGIAIATLYDHLELDGGTYDVSACYRRAVNFGSDTSEPSP